MQAIAPAALDRLAAEPKPGCFRASSTGVSVVVASPTSRSVALFAYRSFYRGVADATQANDDIPASSFFDALGAWYPTTQVMAVRRQTDTGDDAVSLAKLLENMAALRRS